MQCGNTDLSFAQQPTCVDATAFGQRQRLRSRNTIWFMSSWWEYVVRTAKTDVQKQIAEGTGISETAFSRWKQGKNSPEAPHVITFARGYNRPPVEALVAAGILSEEDAAEVIEVHRGLDAINDDELLAEVRKRMKGATHAVLTDQTETPGASGQARQPQEDPSSNYRQNGSGGMGRDVGSKKNPGVDGSQDGEESQDLPG